ncbi:MAG: metal-dependent hydrolase [Candidatus Thermoplasmatota archaeon]
MKGITHFLVGVAVASFFPLAIEATMIEGAWFLVLGGIFGILPDTLDFRFARYLEEHDYEICPEEGELDPKKITDTLIRAIDQAYREKRTIKVKLHSLKVGSDSWRQYSVTFDTDEKAITTEIGPIVSTSQVPYPDTAPTGDDKSYTGHYDSDLLHTYEDETNVDIFSGPDFAFVPEDDRVRADFIPWHRQWAHSFTLAFLLGPIGLLLFGWNAYGLTASMIIIAAFSAHVIVDQLGVLGSNLFYPFTSKRTEGFAIFHSSETIPNVFTNYTSAVVVLWNLNMFSLEPVFEMNPIFYFVLYLFLPLALVYSINWYYKRKKGLLEEKDEDTLREEEAMSEIEGEM